MKKIKGTPAPEQHRHLDTPTSPSQPIGKRNIWTSPLLPVALVAVALVTLGYLLHSQEWEMLYRSQELSLFLPTRQFYEGMTIYPGGTLQWLGCWFTQFFYHPAYGIALMVGLWAAIVALSKYLFHLRGWAVLLALLPVLMLMTGVVQTGYWLYYTKLQGYFFVPTLGVLLSLVAACIYRLLTCRMDFSKGSLLVSGLSMGLGLAWMGVFAWRGYQWMGAWSFLGLGLMAATISPKHLRSVREGGRTSLTVLLSEVLPILVAAYFIYQIPLRAYDSVYCQTQIDTIYVASMPSFSYSNSVFSAYYWPIYLLVASFVVIALTPCLSLLRLKGRLFTMAQGIVLLALLGGSVYYMKERWYHDEAFQRELVMNRCIEEENWEGVLDAAPAWTEADTLKQPTRAMVMMKNLALARLGRAGDEMFNYLEGAKEQSIQEFSKVSADDPFDGEAGYYTRGADDGYQRWTPDSSSTTPFSDQFDAIKDRLYRHHQLNIRLTQAGGKLLYYNYGKLNFCYRWCMEDGVEFGWKVEHLRFMARCALLKGEWKVAQKYLNLLKQTRYHREWAERYEPFIGHPELMAQDPTLAPICKLKEFGDRLDGDNTLVELYLLRTFANGHGVDPVYQEQTLLCSLIMKDIDLFWPRLYEYIQMHSQEPGFHLPRLYQEAAFLYSMLEPNRPSYMWPGMTNAQAMQKLPFDESVKQSYSNFMNFNGRADIAPLPEAQKRIAFQPYYGNTFYYFYFLVRGQKTN